MPCKASIEIPSSTSTTNSSTLVSQDDDLNYSRKPGKSRPKCYHCGTTRLMIDWCYVVHGHLDWSIVVAQTAPSPSPTSGPLIHLISSMSLWNGMMNNIKHLVPLLLLCTQVLRLLVSLNPPILASGARLWPLVKSRVISLFSLPFSLLVFYHLSPSLIVPKSHLMVLALFIFFLLFL